MECRAHDGRKHAPLRRTAAADNALDPVCAKDQIELRIEKSVRPKFQNDRLEVSSVLPVIVRLERVDMLSAPCVYGRIGRRFSVPRFEREPAAIVALLTGKRALLDMNDHDVC